MQFIEFGFPLGLAQDSVLEPSLKNHSSAYHFHTYIDKFVAREISEKGLTGPFTTPPFSKTMLSPLMTAVKNPSSRHPVFDASFGDFSLNKNTPEKTYLGGDYLFSIPNVLNFADIIVALGRNCLMWKRDLSRFFLQLPVDPACYDKLSFVWQDKFYMFTSFVWGCRHAGYSGQRVSSAVLWIFKNLGVQQCGSEFNSLVYMDNFAGAEVGEKASLAFVSMENLLRDLGRAV